MTDQSTTSGDSRDPGRPGRATNPDLAVGRLRGFIAEQRFRPGDRIPPERDLIDLLGLTRTALRRGLDTLEREGLIWRHVGKGTFLSDGAAQAEGTGLVALARRTTPVKMMQARLAIEPTIAREAAMNASAETLDALRAAAARCRNAGDWTAYETADDGFHRAVAQAADNLPLLAVFDQLNAIRRTVAWGHVEREATAPPPDHTSFAEHDAIAAAIQRREPDSAHAAMRGHLRSVSRRLFDT